MREKQASQKAAEEKTGKKKTKQKPNQQGLNPTTEAEWSNHKVGENRRLFRKK